MLSFLGVGWRCGFSGDVPAPVLPICKPALAQMASFQVVLAANSRKSDLNFFLH